ncbi:glycoside hydrolase family 95 protein [Mucilaginibacter conchicola]|uniref:Glycoside hydrolase family 95 protein n=1 Tax=Mucilaginibacter conchicola TaxID=2303333 RepID=A0A372NV56_9SPHI|nr:glycoside hydrolase family 95 protein [Mucilaginibacter conchicola]RFZ94043.1 glycoside hydrolase family 95 protein [Mucilaginibacter conchicola]
MRRILNLILLISVTTCAQVSAQNKPLKLWYDTPASQWEETLPLGNGRLGMTPNSQINEEHIVLNDITLWSGAPQDANNYEANKSLPEIRRLLAEGKNEEAQRLVDKNFICTGKGSGSEPFGKYQVLGDLKMKFQYSGKGTPSNYKRELSLDSAIAKCTFTINDVNYKREYFTSFNNDVSVIKLTASKPGQLSFSTALSREERFTTTAKPGELIMKGSLRSGTDAEGMQYSVRVRVETKGGKVNTDGNNVDVENATEAIIYISAGTNFKNPGYKQSVDKLLAAALKTPYATEKSSHIKKFRKLFNRVNIDLGNSTAKEETTGTRLISFRKDPDADKGLPVLFYQFGRYLTISSTRVGLLPPNLQGLWANQVNTPWNGDYHLDVNVQMNHWPVEVSNLSELNLPLAQLVKGMVQPGERTAKAYYNAKGWVAHVITNIWGFTEPGESASWGVTKVGSGWLCNNLWEHYAFSNDKNYLREIYPILKGAAQFYNDMLIPDKKTGWLVTSPSSSPENSFYLPDGSHASICEGPTIDNQIIRELFGNVITAAKVLGKDETFSKELDQRMKKLPPAGQVAKDGRLMEWLEDYKETEPQHRHVSHLYGLYPASLITTDATPALAEACRKTLEVRGDDGPSWSIAYKQLFWARLHDGNRAYKLFKEIMRPTLKTDINYGSGGGIYPNLFSAGPPFQIDGNFGTTAGIAEMLVQSHAGYIELLPAMPDAWKANGKANGLRARGNYTVYFDWANGKVINYRITSADGRAVKVKINGVMKTVKTIKV